MKNNNKLLRITMTALMAALCYVAFTFLQIKIPTPAGYTSFHLGNVFCVVAAILIDGVSGGIAGAIGMGIADLFDPAYVLTVPKTIIIKFLIGFITGTMAHKVFKIDEKENCEKEIMMSIFVGMMFNVVAEPLLSFLYYDLILNNSDKATSYLTMAKWITTLVNATLTIIIGTTLSIAIRKRIKR